MDKKITPIETLDELDKLSSKEREVFEKMAAIEHARWAGWQKHLHSKCLKDEDGNLIIPKGYAENLERQIKAPFEGLTEEEKGYDREEVLKTWQVVIELS